MKKSTLNKIVLLSGISFLWSEQGNTETPKQSTTKCSGPKWGAEFRLRGAASNQRALGQVDLFAPLIQNDTSLLFADLRFWRDTRSSMEGNYGLAFRKIIPSLQWIFGGYTFFDNRDSEYGNSFQQATFGLEALSVTWDARANLYLPFQKSHSIKSKPRKFKFRGHEQFSSSTKEFALKGFDAEVGRLIPYTCDVRFYAGGYHFQGKGAKTVNGGRARLEWRINRYVSTEVDYQYDNVRHSTPIIWATLRIPFGKDNSKQLTRLEDRMSDVIIRDIDIVTQKRERQVNTGRYFVHGKPGGTGPGTFEDPANSDDREAVIDALMAKGYHYIGPELKTRPRPAPAPGGGGGGGAGGGLLPAHGPVPVPGGGGGPGVPAPVPGGHVPVPAPVLPVGAPHGPAPAPHVPAPAVAPPPPHGGGLHPAPALAPPHMPAAAPVGQGLAAAPVAGGGGLLPPPGGILPVPAPHVPAPAVAPPPPHGGGLHPAPALAPPHMPAAAPIGQGPAVAPVLVPVAGGGGLPPAVPVPALAPPLMPAAAPIGHGPAPALIAGGAPVPGGVQHGPVPAVPDPAEAEREAAATKVQTAVRGWRARREAERLRVENAARDARREAAAQAEREVAAATRIQALARGRKVRRDQADARRVEAEAQAEREAAATKVQTARGWRARREAERLRVENAARDARREAEAQAEREAEAKARAEREEAAAVKARLEEQAARAAQAKAAAEVAARQAAAQRAEAEAQAAREAAAQRAEAEAKARAEREAEAQAEREAAVTRIQALARGRKVRRDQAEARRVEAEAKARAEREEAAQAEREAAARRAAATQTIQDFADAHVARLAEAKAQAEREAAVTRIQALARGRKVRRDQADARRAEAEAQAEREAAATKVQTAVRGWRARREAERLRVENAARDARREAEAQAEREAEAKARAEREEAAQAEREAAARRAAATQTIQDFADAHVARLAEAKAQAAREAAAQRAEAEAKARAEREAEAQAEREAAVTRIQALARGRKVRRDQAEARRVEAEAKARAEREEAAQAEREAAAQAAREAEVQAAREEQAATTVQAAVRRFQARDQYLKDKESVKKAQLAVKGWKARRELAELRREKVEQEAATRIQSTFRGHAERKRLVAGRRDAALQAAQDFVNGHAAQVEARAQEAREAAIQRVEAAAQAEREVAAATRIQALARGRKVRRDQAEARRVEAEAKARAEREEAAVALQSVWRGKKGREDVAAQRAEAEAKARAEREEASQAKREAAATKVQAAVRGWRARREAERLRVENAARDARREAEAQAEREAAAQAAREEQAATTVQAAVRRFQARDQYLKDKESVKKAQLAVKGWKARRELAKLRREKVEQEAATRIQSTFRGHAERKRLVAGRRDAALQAAQDFVNGHAAQVEARAQEAREAAERAAAMQPAPSSPAAARSRTPVVSTLGSPGSALEPLEAKSPVAEPYADGVNDTNSAEWKAKQASTRALDMGALRAQFARDANQRVAPPLPPAQQKMPASLSSPASAPTGEVSAAAQAAREEGIRVANALEDATQEYMRAKEQLSSADNAGQQALDAEFNRRITSLRNRFDELRAVQQGASPFSPGVSPIGGESSTPGTAEGDSPSRVWQPGLKPVYVPFGGKRSPSVDALLLDRAGEDRAQGLMSQSLRRDSERRMPPPRRGRASSLPLEMQVDTPGSYQPYATPPGRDRVSVPPGWTSYVDGPPVKNDQAAATSPVALATTATSTPERSRDIPQPSKTPVAEGARPYQGTPETSERQPIVLSEADGIRLDFGGDGRKSFRPGSASSDGSQDSLKENGGDGTNAAPSPAVVDSSFDFGGVSTPPLMMSRELSALPPLELSPVQKTVDEGRDEEELRRIASRLEESLAQTDESRASGHGVKLSKSLHRTVSRRAMRASLVGRSDESSGMGGHSIATDGDSGMGGHSIATDGDSGMGGHSIVTDGDSGMGGHSIATDGDSGMGGHSIVTDGDSGMGGHSEMTDGDSGMGGHSLMVPSDGDSGMGGHSEMTDGGSGMGGHSLMVPSDGDSGMGGHSLETTPGGDSGMGGHSEVSDEELGKDGQG